MNEFHVALVHLVKRAYPTASAREMINYVQEQTGDELSESDVSRALKDYNPFETLSLKKIESHATEGCTVLRTLWHVMPPPMGHVGVSSASKWDIDETCFYITFANRVMGHAPVGKTPIEDQSHTLGEKLNIILAIDRIGSTELRIQDENLDAEGWIAYLEEDLLPVCGPRRTFMMDNLKAHVTPRALQVMIQAGHRPLARPPYSPWLAPIEFILWTHGGALAAHAVHHHEAKLPAVYHRGLPRGHHAGELPRGVRPLRPVKRQTNGWLCDERGSPATSARLCLQLRQLFIAVSLVSSRQ